MGMFDWFKRVFSKEKTTDDAVEEADGDEAANEPTTPQRATTDDRIRELEAVLVEPLDKADTPAKERALRAAIGEHFPTKTKAGLITDLHTLGELDPGAAIRILRRYEAIAPGDPGLLLEMERLYSLRKDLDAAIRALERLLDQPEQVAEAQERLGRVHERAGRPAQAAHHYQMALVNDWSREHLLDALKRVEHGLPDPPPPAPLAIVAHDPPDGFELLHPLGRGGFGTVYLARDVALDRHVAIKFVHPHYQRRPDKLEALFAEARLTISLDTSGVVGVYGFDRDRGLIVMEYMSHGTVADRLAAGVPLAPSAALRCIGGLARTLELVHARGLVHRDIKPANVLFRSESEPVLGDFGIAGLADADQRHAGTRLYAAPEVLAAKPVGAAADLYGLGLLLAEMLTAARPPRERSGDAWEAWITSASAPLGAHRATVRALLDELLADDPAARTTSASALCRRASQLVTVLS